MATELNDAKITVKLDLEQGEKAVDSLEKRTVEQRKQRDKEAGKIRLAEKKSRAVARTKGRGGVGRAIAAGGLFSAFRGTLNAIAAIPVLEMVAAGGLGAIALSEFNEKFGPFIEELMREQLEKAGVPSFQMDNFVRLSEEVAELKVLMGSITQGFDQSLQAASADILTGGTVTADEFAERFKIERRFAEFSRNLQRAERKLRLRILGAGTAQSVQEEIRKAVTKGMNL